jgi:hypothetical protein
MATDHRTDVRCGAVHSRIYAPWADFMRAVYRFSLAAMTTELPRACRCEAEDTSVLSELLELGQVGE